MADAVNLVSGLRSTFEQSATSDARTMQEMERNLNEIGDYIEEIGRFFRKKSSDVKVLRMGVSDASSGRMNSGYSMAKDLIRDLENQVRHKEMLISRLNEEFARKDSRLSEQEGRCADAACVGGSTAEELADETDRRTVDVRARRNARDFSNQRRGGKNADERDEMISRLLEELRKLEKDNDEKNITIRNLEAAVVEKSKEAEELDEVRIKLEKIIADKDNEYLSNKRLNNMKKLRQLETLGKKSVEIEELICRLKTEIANIAGRLPDGNHCQLIGSSSATTTPNKRSSTSSDFQLRVKELYKPLSEKLFAKKVAIEMFQRDALSFSDLDSIQACRNQCKAASKLLAILLRLPDDAVSIFKCFLEALKITNQEHIFLWISFRDYRIDSEHSELIRRHYKLIMEEMDIRNSGLLTELFAADVIDREENDELDSCESSTRKIERLLSIMSRKSSEQFERFLTALDNTQQRHLADALRRKLSGVNPVVQSMLRATRVVHFDVSDRRAVVGLTSVDDRLLFVLRSPNNRQIEVYDTTTFQLQHMLKIPGLSDGRSNGLTSCAVSNFLYVSDCDRRTVYKLELSDENKLSHWRVGRKPTGVSLNAARNLLVTCHIAKQLQEYTPSGSLVRKVSLKLSPFHAVQLNDDRFVVCYSVSMWLDDVSEMDSQGRVIISYTSLLQSGYSCYSNQLRPTAEHQFYVPRHLAAYGNNGCVFIADCDNNRIVMMNHSLQCINELYASIDGNRLNEPCCLHLRESSGRLYVGEGVSRGRLFLFDIPRQ